MLDVAIIGAGAAGLGAAKTAISKGLSSKCWKPLPSRVAGHEQTGPCRLRL